jgi:GH35 family endo-1,4-beta-xylanase
MKCPTLRKLVLSAASLCVTFGVGSDPRVAKAQSASNAEQTAAPAVARQGPTIKDAYAKHFLIGMAGDIPGNYSDAEKSLVTGHFNAVTPENCMKPAPMHPSEDIWRFERPDALVKFCEENKLAIHGHTLVWHAQTANWFFDGGDKEVVKKRLKDDQRPRRRPDRSD